MCTGRASSDRRSERLVQQDLRDYCDEHDAIAIYQGPGLMKENEAQAILDFLETRILEAYFATRKAEK
jgi:hypothetical protein